MGSALTSAKKTAMAWKNKKRFNADPPSIAKPGMFEMSSEARVFLALSSFNVFF